VVPAVFARLTRHQFVIAGRHYDARIAFEKRKPDELAFQNGRSLSKLIQLAEAFRSRTY